MKKRLLSLLAALCLLLPVGGTAVAAEDVPRSEVTVRYLPALQEKADDAPVIGCKYAYVADPETGKVIYEKNARVPVYPASTTKLLTALVVVENCDLSETAVVSEEAVRLVPYDYIDADLEVGERFSVRDLLYALLIPSANDVAFVLAEHVSGSSEAFVALMNQRAAELGCETLRFVNPNGIHNAEHVCSAYDLFLIARECQKHEILREIVKTRSFTLPATDLHPEEDRVFPNTNELLFGAGRYPYCTGMKTGRTDAAGECLVASSDRDGFELISVVLGGRVIEKQSERFTDTRTLLEYAYDRYARRTVASLGDVVADLRVGKATGGTAQLDAVVGADIAAILPAGQDLSALPVEVAVDESLTAPVARHQVIGTVTYRADGLVYTADLLAGHAVDKLPYWLFNLLVVIVLIATGAACVLLLRKAKGSRGRKRARILIAALAGAEIVLAVVLLCAGAAGAETRIAPARENVRILTPVEQTQISEQGD